MKNRANFTQFYSYRKPSRFEEMNVSLQKRVTVSYENL